MKHNAHNEKRTRNGKGWNPGRTVCAWRIPSIIKFTMGFPLQNLICWYFRRADGLCSHIYSFLKLNRICKFNLERETETTRLYTQMYTPPLTDPEYTLPPASHIRVLQHPAWLFEYLREWRSPEGMCSEWKYKCCPLSKCYTQFPCPDQALCTLQWHYPAGLRKVQPIH